MSYFRLKHLSGFLPSWRQSPVLPYGLLTFAWPDLCSSDFVSFLLVLPIGFLPPGTCSSSILFPLPGTLPTPPSSPGYSPQTLRKPCLYPFSLSSCSEQPPSPTPPHTHFSFVELFKGTSMHLFMRLFSYCLSP